MIRIAILWVRTLEQDKSNLLSAIRGLLGAKRQNRKFERTSLLNPYLDVFGFGKLNPGNPMMNLSPPSFGFCFFRFDFSYVGRKQKLAMQFP
ncbi:MAG: hypothetical protein K8F25_14075, partial [Fimbriimonadaceae bacterium]|nr:hypothetical protein [Alphaproteobacteria bacterium]